MNEKVNKRLTIKNKIINKEQTAKLLGISVASLKNWERHGYLSKIDNQYDRETVINLKLKIESGEIERLNKRANKSKSSGKFIPTECISSKKSLSIINKIVSIVFLAKLSIEKAIFFLATTLFVSKKDINTTELSEILQFDAKNFKREGVFKVLSEQFLDIKLHEFEDDYQELFNIEIPNERDILGIIYQSIIKEGQKSNLGSYYTPAHIVKSLVKNEVDSNSKVLDPCCGTGQFLLEFAQNRANPENIYGFDIDKTAVFIAKVNLLLQFSDVDFEPNIFIQNSLIIDRNFKDKFDFIATNPPWGAKYDRITLSRIKQNFPEIKTKETFSFFIAQSYRFLKKGGKMSFVLPESITNVKTHADIRKFIVEKTEIKQIDILGKCFKNVLSSVISIQLQKNKSINNQIVIKKQQEEYKIEQKRFISNKNNVFDIYITPEDAEIFAKMHKKEHFTLEGKADWALGIVTGDNHKFIKPTAEDSNFEPIYKGGDIEHFSCKKPTNFIYFEPEKLQQVAPIAKYRADEKLIYKFISSNLVFAYDDQKRLTLNSANILIPKVEGYSIKIILGFMNSSLFKYYFKKKFNSVKILRGDLEQLLFPVLSEKQKTEIEQIVNDVLNQKVSRQKLDEYIFNFYGLSDVEIGAMF